MQTTLLDEQLNKIAMWGPTGTGKTWFINAFGRKLKDYQDDPDFFYELLEGDNILHEVLQNSQQEKTEIPVSVKPSETKNIKATEDIQDHVWIFRRRSKKTTTAHSVSSFSHAIHVADNKGQNTIELKNNRAVINLVNSANFIVMMLDPTKLSTVSGDLGSQISPSDYANVVDNLFQAFIVNPHSKRHIAICVTKIDQLHVKQRDPWELILMYFEKEMYEVLQKYNRNENFSLETFAVSAMGFLRDGTNMIPNYEVSNGQLLNPGEWKPYNVDAPLFWLFENLEKQRLRRNNSGVLGKLIFQPEREKLYIPYPIKRK